jgi:hypothetical protein
MAGTSISGALHLKIGDALRPPRATAWGGIALSWAAPTLSCISDFRYRFSILRCPCG